MEKEEIEKRDQQIRERKRKRSTKPFTLQKKIFKHKNISSTNWNPCSTSKSATENPRHVNFLKTNFSIESLLKHKSIYSQNYEGNLKKQFFAAHYFPLSTDQKSNFSASFQRNRYDFIYAMLKQCYSGFFNQTPSTYLPFFRNSQNYFCIKKS